jgi:uncharacterized cupin superfamily protein
MMEGYAIAHRDEMERNGAWTLCRRALALGALGMGIVDIEPGGSIPAHDEADRDQEEVFCVLAGSPTMVIGEAEHPAPAGTFVRVDPALRRHMVNNADDVATVLIVSAPRQSGYEPMGWN